MYLPLLIFSISSHRNNMCQVNPLEIATIVICSLPHRNTVVTVCVCCLPHVVYITITYVSSCYALKSIQLPLFTVLVKNNVTKF
jgi:hypothetical protein